MKVNVVNGFSDQPEGGNPAGVVYLSEENASGKMFPLHESADAKREILADTQMQQIASKLHFSETAFITRLNDRSFAIRYFTPAAEVPLCGHATIASFSYLYQKGVIYLSKINKKRLSANNLFFIIKLLYNKTRIYRLFQRNLYFCAYT